MACVKPTCERCRRQFEATPEQVREMARAPQAPAICDRIDCAALAAQIELQQKQAKQKAKRKFPPELREVSIREGEIQRQILQWLTYKRIFAWRQNQGGMRVKGDENARTVRGRRGRFIRFAHVDGISDIIGVYRARFLAIEVKRPGEQPTDDQRNFLDRVDKEKGIAILAYSLDDVISALADVDKGDR